MKSRTLLAATMAALGAQALYAGPQNSTESANSSQEMRLSKLMDADAKSKNGEDLGKVENVLLNPKTGKIEYVVIGRGGLLGVGEKLVPVPWKALNLTSEKEFTINVDKNKLKSAPTTDKQFSEMQQPDYYVTIYRFYEIPVESAGGAESPSGSQSGGASSQSGSQSSQGSSGGSSSQSQSGSSDQNQTQNPK